MSCSNCTETILARITSMRVSISSQSVSRSVGQSMVVVAAAVVAVAAAAAVKSAS